jgi:hypothetical protein
MYNSFLGRFENNLGVSSKVLPCDSEMMKTINCNNCDYVITESDLNAVK